VNAEVVVFPAVVDHGWKHDYLRIHTATEGCNCSLKELLIMGTIVSETC
jgi:hypothetical protein